MGFLSVLNMVIVSLNTQRLIPYRWGIKSSSTHARGHKTKTSAMSLSDDDGFVTVGFLEMNSATRRFYDGSFIVLMLKIKVCSSAKFY